MTIRWSTYDNKTISTKGFPGTLDSIKTFSSAGSGQQTLGPGHQEDDDHEHQGHQDDDHEHQDDDHHLYHNYSHDLDHQNNHSHDHHHKKMLRAQAEATLGLETGTELSFQFLPGRCRIIVICAYICRIIIHYCHNWEVQNCHCHNRKVHNCHQFLSSIIIINYCLVIAVFFFHG